MRRKSVSIRSSFGEVEKRNERKIIIKDFPQLHYITLHYKSNEKHQETKRMLAIFVETFTHAIPRQIYSKIAEQETAFYVNVINYYMNIMFYFN